MKVRNSKSCASIENGLSVWAVIIYTSDDVVVSITEVIPTCFLCHYVKSRSRQRPLSITAACDAHNWINQLSLVARKQCLDLRVSSAKKGQGCGDVSCVCCVARHTLSPHLLLAKLHSSSPCKLHYTAKLIRKKDDCSPHGISYSFCQHILCFSAQD